MLDVLLTASVSFIITFLAIPVILQIAEQKKLYDVPDERKVHTHPVASLGQRITPITPIPLAGGDGGNRGNVPVEAGGRIAIHPS